MHLDTEASLISSRTNWVFASNAFLFSAYAAVSVQDPAKSGGVAAEHLKTVVPLLGMIFSLGSVVLIAAAVAVSFRLQSDLRVAIEMCPRRKSKDRPAHGSAQGAAERGHDSSDVSNPIGIDWATAGRVFPDIRGIRWANLVGLWIPALLGIALLVIWLWLLLTG